MRTFKFLVQKWIFTPNYQKYIYEGSYMEEYFLLKQLGIEEIGCK